MLIDTRTLPKDERTYLELGALYERNGYALYKMKKFEEYSLYVDNRNFLGSESVLTFQGFGGKLMALKPDVTLSIVKNARVPEDRPLRLYYRESVYRTERGGTDFKEINQMGLECIGALDGEDVRGICALAAESLSVIDPDFIFSVSHMGYISALLDECGVRDAAARKKVTDCIRSRNAHDLASAAGEGADTEKIARILRAGTEFSSALEILRAASAGEGTRRRGRTCGALRKFCGRALPRPHPPRSQHSQRRGLLHGHNLSGIRRARAEDDTLRREIRRVALAHRQDA